MLAVWKWSVYYVDSLLPILMNSILITFVCKFCITGFETLQTAVSYWEDASAKLSFTEDQSKPSLPVSCLSKTIQFFQWRLMYMYIIRWKWPSWWTLFIRNYKVNWMFCLQNWFLGDPVHNRWALGWLEIQNGHYNAI